MYGDLTWREAVEVELGARLGGWVRIGGGDFAESFRAETENGQQLFIKTHRSPPENFFSTEATGLSWLREAKAVAVPEVVAVSEAPPFLVLRWVEQGPPTRSTDERFGRDLARLHGSGFETFGRPDNRTTGSQAMDNRPCESWAEFYAQRRLLPLADKAAALRALPPATIDRIYAVASKIDELVGPSESPSLLHGDLWGGNRIVDTDGTSWLIDPAAFGGHREFDLALMQLFGGFSSDTFVAYEAEYPLADGWEDRILE